MQTLTQQHPWKQRLVLPAYQLKAAASYAGVTPKTVRNWQTSAGSGAALAHRHHGESLSYLQLQELAIVSAMRKIGVKLEKIRVAREYLATLLNCEFPFADERVKSDSQDILVALAKGDLPGLPRNSILIANTRGQYVWPEIIGKRFKEFEYERGLALKWHLTSDKRVIIDPRVSFGAPTVKGVPTWALQGRATSGEPMLDIADDFGLTLDDVKSALKFEHSILH